MPPLAVRWKSLAQPSFWPLFYTQTQTSIQITAPQHVTGETALWNSVRLGKSCLVWAWCNGFIWHRVGQAFSMTAFAWLFCFHSRFFRLDTVKLKRTTYCLFPLSHSSHFSQKDDKHKGHFGIDPSAVGGTRQERASDEHLPERCTT